MDCVILTALKGVNKERKAILKGSSSILYTSKHYLGNFIETEVIKSNGVFYKISATNKHLTEFTEV